MSMVISYAVGNGDMFSIQHNSDNFTIIDCSMSSENEDRILDLLKIQIKDKGISRFISTHPDQDHIMGLKKLDCEIPIYNFYCVNNSTTKSDETEDFKHYCQLRDGDKAFHIYKGCTRRWMNLGNDERLTSGIQILWPDTENDDFKSVLVNAANGESPNNISPIITYAIKNSATFAWFGDLETDFMEKIKDDVSWPDVDILFAPHHGRDSGKIPETILSAMKPKIIIIGEAPSEHLNYYGSYKTITQNSAGIIAFECYDGYVHISVDSDTYKVDFLSNQNASTYLNYLGSLYV